MIQKLHITDKQLEALFHGALPPEEQLSLLEHISHCAHCAERMAGCADMRPSHPPAGFSDEVTQKIRQKKREWYQYCARVAIAMCASLVLVFAGSFTERTPTLTPPDLNKANAIAQKMGDFSQKLIIGGFKNDQETK